MARSSKKSNGVSLRKVCVIDGNRTPFLRSGTEFNALSSYDLGRYAVSGLLQKTGVDVDMIDQVVFGSVIPDPGIGNVAREVSLGSGIPISCPAYTVSEACITANQAIANAADQIAMGHADIAVAGGTGLETHSRAVDSVLSLVGELSAGVRRAA